MDTANTPNWAIRTAASNTITDAVFHATSAIYRTSGIESVRFVFYLRAAGLEVAPGCQFSDDGVNWTDDPVIDADYNTSSPTNAWIFAQDRTILDSWRAIPDDFEELAASSPGAATLGRFVRFGVWVKNKTATSGTQAGEIAVEVEQDGVESSVLTQSGVSLTTGGSTASYFTPMSRIVAANTFSKARLSWEQVAAEGVVASPGYQTSEDMLTWSSANDLGTTPPTQTGDGTKLNSDWETVVSPGASFKYVRFGLSAKNSDTGLGARLAAVAAITVEVRK